MAAVAAAARAHAGGGRAAGPNLRWAAVPSMNLDSPGSNVRQFANSNSQPSVQQSQAGSSQLKDHHMHQQARPMLHGSAGGASGARSRESSGESFGSADDPALQPSLGAGGGGRTSGATMTSGAYTKMVQAAEARILKLKQQKADATASVGRAEEHGESVDNASLEVAKLHSQVRSAHTAHQMHLLLFAGSDEEGCALVGFGLALLTISQYTYSGAACSL